MADISKIELPNGDEYNLKDSSTYHVATYSNTNGNNDGKYYKISINSFTSWMLAFRVCAYHKYETYEFEISGYNYGTNYWYSPAAMMVTSSYIRTIDVSFGYDSAWHLWVAFPAYQYSGVAVSLKANGYTQVEDEKNLFTVELVDSLPETVQTTKSCTRPWYRNETVAKATADASGNTITTYYAPKSTAVTNVALATNKITKTINGTTTDVVTAASTSAYGITKLNSATNSTSTTEAATPSAVKTAYDLANTANGTANTALSGVNGTLIYDHTYSISNGVATFTPHVYLKGQEVTTNYAVSCFGWKYRLIDGSEVNLTTNTNRGCTVTITNLGYGGHVIGTFTPPS